MEPFEAPLMVASMPQVHQEALGGSASFKRPKNIEKISNDTYLLFKTIVNGSSIGWNFQRKSLGTDLNVITILEDLCTNTLEVVVKNQNVRLCWVLGKENPLAFGGCHARQG